MFGIGFFELVVIAVVALIFIGPQRLPEMAKQFGKYFVQFKRITQDARQAVDDVIKDAEREVLRDEHERFQKALHLSKPTTKSDSDSDPQQ